MHRIMKKGENMRLFFTKMHGLGNDYIYMDGFDSRMSKPAAWPSEQKEMCIRDRHISPVVDKLENDQADCKSCNYISTYGKVFVVGFKLLFLSGTFLGIRSGLPCVFW